MDVENPAYGKLTMAGIPIQLDQTPGKQRHAPPVVGQHTTEVLRDWLGLDEAKIADLRTRKAV